MKIEGFIWLEQYVDKLEVKHDVTPEEPKKFSITNPVSAKSKRVINVENMSTGH